MEQRERYARHLMLPNIGEAGQLRLLRSRVLIVGLGGLGSPAAMYLAAAGIGTLGLVDNDKVEASNLQRQVIHATSRIGKLKVDSATGQIEDLNPDVKVEPYSMRLEDEDIARALFSQYDVVVDGTDNLKTRYLANDIAVSVGVPLVHGAIYRFLGQVTTLVGKKAARKVSMPSGPCYRCLYPEPPPATEIPSCAEAGVLGVLPGVIGPLMATEVVKLIVGIGECLVGRMVMYDALKMAFSEMSFKPSVQCRACGERG